VFWRGIFRASSHRTRHGLGAVATIGRDTTDAVKSHAVKQYIETAWERTDDGDLIRPETDTEVAEKLGVSQQLVNEVIKNTTGGIIYHDRVAAREYYEKHPDASYREVARQVDSSQPTVTEWLKEDFDEGDGDDEQQDTLAVVARDKDEAERAAEVTRTAADGGGAVADTATAKATELARADADPDDAAAEIEQAEREHEEERQRKERETRRRQAFESAETAVETDHFSPPLVKPVLQLHHEACHVPPVVAVSDPPPCSVGQRRRKFAVVLSRCVVVVHAHLRPDVDGYLVNVDVQPTRAAVERLGDLPDLAAREIVASEDLLDGLGDRGHVIAGVGDGVAAVAVVELAGGFDSVVPPGILVACSDADGVRNVTHCEHNSCSPVFSSHWNGASL
jgi:hypothetical protein